MNDKMIEEMAKLDIEESAGFYSAFINDMRISKNKPLSSSKTVMSFNCPKKYILNAIGIPEGSVVLNKEEYQTLFENKLATTQTKVDEELAKQARKEKAERDNAIKVAKAIFTKQFGVEVEE